MPATMPAPRFDDRPCPPRPSWRPAAVVSLLLSCGLAGAAAAAAPADPQTLLNGGQAAQALQWVEEQSTLSPWDSRLTAQRAMLLSLLHRDQQALRLLEEMAGRNPNEPATYNLMALIHVGSGDFESARSAAQRALRADVGYVPALKTIAEIETRLARQFYDHAARLDRGADPTLGRKAAALTEVIGNARVSAFAQPGALLTLVPALTAEMPRLTRSSIANGDDGLTITVSRPPGAGPAAASAVQPLLALATVPAGRAGVLVSPPTSAGQAAAAALQSQNAAAAPTFASLAAGSAAPAGFFGVPKSTVAPLNAVDTLGTPTVRAQWQAAEPSSSPSARPAAAGRPAWQPPPPSQPVPPSRDTAAPSATTAHTQPAGGAAPAAESQAQVDAALRRWAAAWRRRDVAGYVAAYDADFSGRFTSATGGRAAWERERAERIGERASIDVELSEVAITVDGDQARASFRQRYQSGKVASVDRKTLYWQRLPGGAWVIKREIVGG